MYVYYTHTYTRICIYKEKLKNSSYIFVKQAVPCKISAQLVYNFLKKQKS